MPSPKRSQSPSAIERKELESEILNPLYGGTRSLEDCNTFSADTPDWVLEFEQPPNNDDSPCEQDEAEDLYRRKFAKNGRQQRFLTNPVLVKKKVSSTDTRLQHWAIPKPPIVRPKELEYKNECTDMVLWQPQIEISYPDEVWEFDPDTYTPDPYWDFGDYVLFQDNEFEIDDYTKDYTEDQINGVREAEDSDSEASSYYDLEEEMEPNCDDVVLYSGTAATYYGIDMQGPDADEAALSYSGTTVD